MEYSVYDLLRILLKRWYIILLAMLAAGAAAYFLSSASREYVQESYDQLTQAPPAQEAGFGDRNAAYQCQYTLLDYSTYLDAARNKNRFLDEFSQAYLGESEGQEADVQEDGESGTAGLVSVESMAATAYAQAQEDFSHLLTSAEVLRAVQTAIDDFGYLEPSVTAGAYTTDALTVSGHLEVDVSPSGLLTMTVKGLSRDVSAQIITSYLDCLAELGQSLYSMEIRSQEVLNQFSADTEPTPESVILAQTTMKEPDEPMSLVRTVVTAALYSFVFACFAVLLFTFLRDSRRAGKDAGNSSR